MRELDLMIMVADPSRQGLETVRRLSALAREMEIKVKQLALVINRLRRDALPARLAARCRPKPARPGRRPAGR